MKSKTVPVLIIISVVFLGVAFFVTNKFYSKKDKSLTRAKIVTPKSSVSSDSDSDRKGTGLESEKYETFVPLLAGETLISTLTIDINNDGYDDEVIIVRKSTSQNLWLVAALINPDTGVYERLTPVETQFTKTRTFSYTGMDITGEHKTALIYQGAADDGNYIMEIFHWVNENGKNELVNIGDFSCDGTVFIQQTERSESYEMALSKGESFSVWVYKSEQKEEDATATAENQNANKNQIQQEYKWNPSLRKYELSQEIKVTAGRLAAKELSRIQDGTVETFASFLNGLWYKTSNNDGEIRYLFFDYDSGEIIQLYKDTQEVYEWEDSKILHNGIYVTSINADIMNLHRRFNIYLVGVDEIRVTLRDDINLVIKENPLWDGQYKKMSLQSSFDDAVPSTTADVFIRELKKGPSWSTSDNLISITFDDFSYTLQTSDMTESGVYLAEVIGGYNILQFRSDSDSSFLNEIYSMEFGTKTVTETVKKKTVEKVVTDYNTIMLTPVKVTPTDCFAVEGNSYTLVR